MLHRDEGLFFFSRHKPQRSKYEGWQDFVAREACELSEQQKAGLLTREEYLTLNLELGLYAKEAFTTPIFDLLDELSIDSWDSH